MESSCDWTAAKGPAWFEIETWVGPHAGRLRIASLHAFTASWASPSANRLALSVRFCEQGLGCTDVATNAVCRHASTCTGYEALVETAARA